MSMFQVGPHRVSTSLRRGRWSVKIDQRLLPGWFPTEAEAWAAGVREADRMDVARGRAPGAAPG